jgi:hypothetical protein
MLLREELDRVDKTYPNHKSLVLMPYWSSHLKGAQSERIVPSDHGSHQNKQGMKEAVRILRFNLDGAGALQGVGQQFRRLSFEPSQRPADTKNPAGPFIIELGRPLDGHQRHSSNANLTVNRIGSN